MKCVKGTGLLPEPYENEVFRTSDKNAAELVSSGVFRYASKAEWKAGGRMCSGPQDHAPNSIHPRRGWANKRR